MKNRVIVFILVLFVILLSGTLACALRWHTVTIDDYTTIDRQPIIYPDYTSTAIPPNIAPLNFMVREKGLYYCARIYSKKGKTIEVFSRSPKIRIPMTPWHSLLETNTGQQLHFDIFVRADDQSWTRFATITNKIANDDIDGYLVFRRMHPTHVLTRGRVGIYQRNLSNFDESTIFDNSGYMTSCLNCHSFCQNKPDKVLLGVRSDIQRAKTLLIEPDKVTKLDTKFGYTAWHPSGKLAVYSINKLPMFFHTARSEVRDTFDLNSALAYFIVGSNTVRTSPEISRKDQLETWPTWSADGRYLYFCIAPITWSAEGKFPPDGYEKLKYDLVRISYDIEQDKWGKIETVLSAKDIGRSIAMPRTSPDGRWLTFSTCDYGYFPPWQQNSDLYIMDLESAQQKGRYQYRRLDINSDQSEAWLSWSANSRWIVFSSKRSHGAFTRSYLSYVDENGKAYKPLVLPQKDPAFYDRCLETFNTPEFVTGPIPAVGEKLTRVVRGPAEIAMDIPITMATPKAGSAPTFTNPWLDRE